MNKASYRNLIRQKSQLDMGPRSTTEILESFNPNLNPLPGANQLNYGRPINKNKALIEDISKRKSKNQQEFKDIMQKIEQEEAMSKAAYREIIKKRADAFPAGSPANSPIGQAVMNNVMPGVGTAAKEMNESFGKTDMSMDYCKKDLYKFEGPDVKHWHGDVVHSHPVAQVEHTHSDGSVPDGEISSQRPGIEGESIFGKAKYRKLIHGQKPSR